MFINVKMTSNAEEKLRRQLQQTADRLKKTEFNLEAQKVEVKELSNLYWHLKDDFNALSREKHDLQEQIRVLNHNNNRLVAQRNRLRQQVIDGQNAGDFEPIIFNKVWHELRSTLSKRKRKKMYRAVIDRSIRQIVECGKARVLLTLGNEDISLQWSEQELSMNREDLFNEGYLFPQNIVPAKVDIEPLYFERQDDKFRFTHTKEEIRKVICVMDSQNIASPAYHELHVLSRGVLPPLNKIKEQKKEMGEKLNFYIVPGVSVKTIVNIEGK